MTPVIVPQRQCSSARLQGGNNMLNEGYFPPQIGWFEIREQLGKEHDWAQEGIEMAGVGPPTFSSIRKITGFNAWAMCGNRDTVDHPWIDQVRFVLLSSWYGDPYLWAGNGLLDIADPALPSSLPHIPLLSLSIDERIGGGSSGPGGPRYWARDRVDYPCPLDIARVLEIRDGDFGTALEASDGPLNVNYLGGPSQADHQAAIWCYTRIVNMQTVCQLDWVWEDTSP